MLADTFLELNFPSMVVIFSSLATTYTLSPELDEVVFNIDGIPYCPPRTPKDREFLSEMKKLCYEKLFEAVKEKYAIILINNTPLTLEVMQELYTKPDLPNASDWLIVSFFHADIDHEINRVQVTDTEYLNPQVMLDVKSKDMASLTNYPFIKKVIIPFNFQITSEYLTKLFDK